MRSRVLSVLAWALLVVGIGWTGFIFVQVLRYMHYANEWTEWGRRSKRTEAERRMANEYTQEALRIQSQHLPLFVYGVPPLVAGAGLWFLARRRREGPP